MFHLISFSFILLFIHCVYVCVGLYLSKFSTGFVAVTFKINKVNFMLTLDYKKNFVVFLYSFFSSRRCSFRVPLSRQSFGINPVISLYITYVMDWYS